ncbi:MAG: hypothetical protein ACFFDW_00045 [Candidatus Thorarchaeota archaeon]
MKIEIPRKWFLVIIGIADWREKAKKLPHDEFLELQQVIDDYISKTYKDIRKRGGFVISLFWSQENLAPCFLLEATSMNEKFLKELRAKFSDVVERINAGLSSNERASQLGKNLQTIAPEGRILVLELKIPEYTAYLPKEESVNEAFSDAFNSELVCIKRAEHDFNGRKNWLSTLDAPLNREIIREVGPVKKIREAKEIEGKRLYEKSTPGDFEKITRVLSEAVAFRSSLFDLQALSTSFGEKEPLGHLVIQYLVCGGDFPIKLNKRSNMHERIGRKVEELQLVSFEGVDWTELDKLLSISENIIYDKFEKVVSDVGGIKLDAFWTERDLSSNVFLLPKFSFTEDVLKSLNEFVTTDSRQLLQNYIGPSTASLFDVWRRAGLHYNLLVFEIRGLDQEEDKRLVEWIKELKNKEIPGPNYNAEKETVEEKHYRPF